MFGKKYHECILSKHNSIHKRSNGKLQTLIACQQMHFSSLKKKVIFTFTIKIYPKITLNLFEGLLEKLVSGKR